MTHIPDLRKLLEELEYEDRLFRIFWRSGPVPMAISSAGLDDFGKYLEVNDRYSLMLGRSKDELLGMTFADVTHPDDRLADADHAMGVRQGRMQPRSGHYKRYIHRDGSVVPVRLFVSFVKNGCADYFLLTAMKLDDEPGDCPYLPPGKCCQWRDMAWPTE